MSKIIAAAAIRGAHDFVNQAEAKLAAVMEAQGGATRLEFPNTAFYLPLILATTGIEVKTVEDAQAPLRIARNLLRPLPTDQVWLPYLGDDARRGRRHAARRGDHRGADATSTASRSQRDLARLHRRHILRTLGIQLVDGRMPGFAAIRRRAADQRDRGQPRPRAAGAQHPGLLAGHTNGRSIAEQLAEEGVEMGWDTYIVPYGQDTSAAIYALNLAARAAMTFGGVKPGDLDKARQILHVQQGPASSPSCSRCGEVGRRRSTRRPPARSTSASRSSPTRTSREILPTGICTYEHVVAERHPRPRSSPARIEVRGVKVKVDEDPDPGALRRRLRGRARPQGGHAVSSSAASTPRRSSTCACASWTRSRTARSRWSGPDIDTAEEGGAMPLGILVEVAGRKMQKDFESIIERQHPPLRQLRHGHLAHGPARHASGCASARTPSQAASGSSTSARSSTPSIHDEFSGNRRQGAGDHAHRRRRRCRGAARGGAPAYATSATSAWPA